MQTTGAKVVSLMIAAAVSAWVVLGAQESGDGFISIVMALGIAELFIWFPEQVSACYETAQAARLNLFPVSTRLIWFVGWAFLVLGVLMSLAH